MAQTTIKKSFFQKSLDGIETVGNKLPHPVALFFILSCITVLLSAIFNATGSSVTYIRAGDEVTVAARSLLSREGISWIFTSAVSNFTGFAPLGTVLVAMLGVGAAEHVGLISALIRKLVLSTPKPLITLVIVFAGVMSNIASDAGYIVLIPLGAAVFYALGRHPIAGLAAAFFGVSGGFSANLLIGTLDPLLSGISQQAAQMVEAGREVPVTSNWYFMFVSTFIVTAIGTFVTEKIVMPRLGAYKPEDGVDAAGAGVSMEVSAIEKRGLRFSGLFLLAALVLIVALSAPAGSPLRHAQTGNLFPTSPLMTSIVFIIMILFLVASVGYGIGVGTIKNDRHVVGAMGKAMSSMGGYLVLAFFASQFVAYFNHSNMGTILSVNGARGLESIGFTGLPLILAFVLLSAFLNLFIGSASAKWAIMAPIFIPMFMHLGFDPAFTQVAYRIGDSVTNIITPLMTYFALIVVFAEKYDKKAGIGTLIATMLPYSIFALLGWTVLLIIWYVLGLPVGLGGAIYL